MKKEKSKLNTESRGQKKCPVCKIILSSAVFYNTEVDYCKKCLGIWFDDDELRWVKDEKDKNLNWLDIDLWKDEKKFKVGRGIRICPSCRVPLYEVYYGDSGVVVDVCNICHGIWLDRMEFKKIIGWIRVKADNEILDNYAGNLFKEAKEIFTGPETLREEINDFLVVLKIMNYKFSAKHPVISKIISSLPR
jgi:Zn-finger nucleic acid-binding protein